MGKQDSGLHAADAALLRAPAAGLRLWVHASVDAITAGLLRTELDAITDPLLPFGQFRGEVAWHGAVDQQTLARAAMAPVDGPICAAATHTTVVSLSPALWPVPPATHELRCALCHELAHVLLFQRCASPGRAAPPALPTWLREGMAIVASEGRPPAARRQFVAGLSHLAEIACADARLVARDPVEVYAAAGVLFDRWWEQHGARRLDAVGRLMRDGAAFEAAHAAATGVAPAAWLQTEIAALRRWARG